MQIAPICFFNSISLDPRPLQSSLQNKGYNGSCLLLSCKYSGGARFKSHPATYCTIRRLNNNRFIPGSFKFEHYLAIRGFKVWDLQKSIHEGNVSIHGQTVSFPFRQTKSRNRKAKWQQSIAVSPSQTVRPPTSSHSFLSSSTNHSMTSSHSPQLFARPGRSQ